MGWSKFNGWITRVFIFQHCWLIGSVRVGERVEQQVVLSLQLQTTSSASSYQLNLGIACHANLPSLAHSYFASSRILPSYANHIGCQLDDIWDWEYASLHTTWFFGKVSGSVVNSQNCWARLPKIISDVAKFCLTITEDALKFSPSIMPNRLFARQPDCMIAANRHCKIKL